MFFLYDIQIVVMRLYLENILSKTVLMQFIFIALYSLTRIYHRLNTDKTVTLRYRVHDIQQL